MEARAHCTQLAANNPGDLLVCHALDETKHQHLSMLGHEGVERVVDTRGILRREIVRAPCLFDEVELFEREIRSPPTHLAESAVSRQSVDPGGKGGGLDQRREAAEGVQPYFLKGVLRGLHTTEHFPQVVAQSRCITGDDLLKRSIIPSLAAQNQDPFIEPIRGIGHGGPRWVQAGKIVASTNPGSGLLPLEDEEHGHCAVLCREVDRAVIAMTDAELQFIPLQPVDASKFLALMAHRDLPR
jgi:hypothetical protein